MLPFHSRHSKPSAQMYSASAYLVPKRYRGPVGWIVGWLNLTGQISAVASGEFAVAGLVRAQPFPFPNIVAEALFRF